jgi:hypothetical protein
MIVRAFVDRIETLEGGDRIAVLVLRWREGDYFTWLVPLDWLPPETKESDWLEVTFEIDTESKARTQQAIEQVMKELKSSDGV